MKKERIWIAGLIIVFVTMVLFTGLIQRMQYENRSRFAFVSTDIANLKQYEKNNLDALNMLSEAGSNVVTVEPLTVKGLKDAGKLELISYSSLFINQDAISQQTLAALGDYQMKPENLIAIVTDTSLSEFLSLELSYRYNDYTNAFLEDGQTMVFAFQNLTQENDLIVGYDYLDLDLIERSGQKAAIVYPSYTFEHPVYPKYFKEFINSNNVSFVILKNNPYDNQKNLSDEMKAVLRTLDFTLVVYENENQISNQKPYLYNQLFEIMKSNVIRGFHMDKIVEHDQSLYRYRYYQWFNSLIERNTVFIHTNLLSNPGVDTETNFSLTVKAISDFTGVLKGYEFPQIRESIAYSYPVDTVAMAGGILALSLLYLYLMFLLPKTPSYFTESYFGAMIASVIFSYALSEYLCAFYAWLIMVCAASLGTMLLFYFDKTFQGGKKLLWMLLSLVSLLIVSIVGICALLGGIEFYTSTALFYGVKLSLLLPIALTALNLYCVYYLDVCSLRELPKAFWKWCKQVNKWILLPVGIVVVLILVYYLLRSGKTNLILPLEDSFRKWLTDVFYIRPRFKEFLFGYPMLALFLYASLSNARMEWKVITGMCVTILFTSVLNTFCHTFTAVYVSLWRIANGFLCGLLVSAVIIGVILLVQKLIFKKYN